MKFYMYSKPVETKRGGKVACLLLRLSTEIIPELEDELVRRISLNRPEEHFKRLEAMLYYGGYSGDEWYVLDHNRTERDVINHMNTWRK